MYGLSKVGRGEREGWVGALFRCGLQAGRIKHKFISKRREMRAAIHFQRLIKGNWDRGDNLLKAFYDRHHLSACGEGFRRVFMFLH